LQQHLITSESPQKIILLLKHHHDKRWITEQTN
jgi:hypothetical protein